MVARPDISTDQLSRYTLLGLVGPDGTFNHGVVRDAMEAAGVNSDRLRVGLQRLVNDGLLERSGRGRRATFAITDRGRQVLQPDVAALRFSFRQDAGNAPWNRRWHIAAFEIPEVSRQARNTLRDTLLNYGAALGPGLYVSAHNWRPMIDPVIGHLELTDRVTHLEAEHLEYRGLSQPDRIARELWPLDELAANYQLFIDRFADGVDRLQSGDRHDTATVLALSIRVVRSFELCARKDPLLPAELLPSDWPGPAARRLLARSRALVAGTRATGGATASLFSIYDEAIDPYLRTE